MYKSLRLTPIKLDRPVLSQKNQIHDWYANEYRRLRDEAIEADVEWDESEFIQKYGVDIGHTGSSEVWCGRAAASIIYNYYQLIESYVGGEPEGRAVQRMIVNNQKINSGKPLDLVYPDSSIACHNPSDDRYFYLSQPLQRCFEGWERQTLFSESDREAFTEGDDVFPSMSEAEVREVLKPVTDSIRRNTPVLARTGISLNEDEPQHIVVFCGVKTVGGHLWIKVADPSSMISKVRPINESPLNGDVLEVVDAGNWVVFDYSPETHTHDPQEEPDKTPIPGPGRGSIYWLRAQRLFEAQQFSSVSDDLWLDHVKSPGLDVTIHPSHVTPPSPYASGNVIAHVPVDLGDETQAERLFLKTY